MNSKRRKKIYKLIKPNLKLLFIAMIFICIVNLCQVLKPYIIKIIIDDFLIKSVKETRFYNLTFMGIYYFIIVFLSSLLSYFQQNIMNVFSQNILFSLRKEIFSIIHYLPLSVLDKYSSGQLITRSTNDIEALNEFFTTVLINLFKDIVLLIGIIYMMFSLNLKLTFLSFSLLPIIVYIVFHFKNKVKANFKRIKNLIGRINSFFAENIMGMKLIQIFNREDYKVREFKELHKEYYNATKLQIKLNSLLGPVADVFETLSIALLIWFTIGDVKNSTLQLGVLYAFTNYIKQFFGPISDIADNYTTIQSAVVSFDRIFELLDLKELQESFDTGLNLEEFKGKIEFKNVWFSYDDKNWILKNVSFTINPGETAAIIGSTGSGKTTIINLISRFYNIQKGNILIDDIDIKDISLKSLRNNISIVLQDVFLFAGDINKNIKLSSPISDEECEEAAKQCCADIFINELNYGFYEKVMEGGSTFSLGQRQLISFARALAHKPSILIMDEATSNIDTKTEVLLQKSIDNVSSDKTAIIIAHRLSTIKKADKVIVLNNGEIVEMGAPYELLQSGKYYKELFKAQSAI